MIPNCPLTPSTTELDVAIDDLLRDHPHNAGPRAPDWKWSHTAPPLRPVSQEGSAAPE